MGFEQTERKPTEEPSDEETKESFAYRWSMIPMTRAVDSLVITLKNPKGDYATALRAVAAKNPDFVEWLE